MVIVRPEIAVTTPLTSAAHAPWAIRLTVAATAAAFTPRIKFSIFKAHTAAPYARIGLR
jgi:hypothetical protein